MATRVHLYKVDMTCEGCANSISNVLNKNRGGLKKAQLNAGWLASATLIINDNMTIDLKNKHCDKDKGIQSFDVDLKEKIVTVKGTLDSNAILEIIQKTGKAVSYLGERK